MFIGLLQRAQSDQQFVKSIRGGDRNVCLVLEVVKRLLCRLRRPVGSRGDGSARGAHKRRASVQYGDQGDALGGGSQEELMLAAEGQRASGIEQVLGDTDEPDESLQFVKH